MEESAQVSVPKIRFAGGTETTFNGKELFVPLSSADANIARVLRRYDVLRTGILVSTVKLPEYTLVSSDDKTGTVGTASVSIGDLRMETINVLDVAESMEVLAIARVAGSINLRIDDVLVLQGRTGRDPRIVVFSLSNATESPEDSERVSVSDLNEQTVYRCLRLELTPMETGFRDVPGPRVSGKSGLSGKFIVPARVSVDGPVSAIRAGSELPDDSWILDADTETLETEPVTIFEVPDMNFVADYCQQLLVSDPLRTSPLYCHFEFDGRYYIVVHELYENENNIMARFLRGSGFAPFVSRDGIPTIVSA